MGRPKGAKNLSTRAREEQAKVEIANALANAKRAGRADPVSALDEMYKAIAISQGVAAKLRPRDITQDAQGNVNIVGGDLEGFGDWFDRWVRCVELLVKYQLPPIKAMEAPSAPPDPEAVERDSKVVFGLRVFEGGRPIQPLRPLGENDDDDA